MPADSTLEIPLKTTPPVGATPVAIVEQIAATRRWAAEPVRELESLAERLAETPGTLSSLRAGERMRLSGVASGHVPPRSARTIAAGGHGPSTQAFVRRFAVAASGATGLRVRTETARHRILSLALDAAVAPASRDEAYAVKLEAERAREALSALGYRAQRARGRLVGLLRRVPPPPPPPSPRSTTQEIPLRVPPSR